MLLIFPKMVLGARSKNIRKTGNFDSKDNLKQMTVDFLNNKDVKVTDSERIRLNRIAKYGYDEVCFFFNTANFKDIIEKLWDINLHPKLYQSYQKSIRYLDEDYDPDSEPKFAIRKPDWYVGFSNEFVKSISKIDRKKQGRILEAIGTIAKAPAEITGNTVKPLSGNLKGLWRCRIGDDRLIYYPDLESRQIVLIMFSSRGDVYNNIPDISALT